MILSRTFSRLLSVFTLAGLSIASATTVTTPDNGDVFLGVRASGGQGSGVSLLINLADDTALKNAAAGSTQSLGNFEAALTTAFGANWATRSDVSWGVFGARNLTNPVVYGSRPQSPVGFPATAYAEQDLTQRTSTKNQVVSVTEAYALLDQFSSSANIALQTNSLNSGSYSFQVGAAGTTDFGSLSQWTTIEGDFSAGVSGTVLDFFLYGGTPSLPATSRLGSFEISSTGAVSFTRALPAGVAGIKFAAAAFHADEDDGHVTLTFRRTDDVSAAVSATFSTVNDSALAGTDYTAQSNVTVSFAINEFEKTVQVPVQDRAGISASRSFNVTLANASSGAQLVSPSSATVTINDTDSEVQFTSATASLRALNVLNQENTVELTVNRLGNLTEAATVNASIGVSSTLSNGTHFTFTSPTQIEFIAGDNSETIEIPLSSIPANVLPGTIVVTLGSPTGTSLGTIASSTVTVLPNSGEIAFSSATFTANAVTAANVPNVATVTLTRTNGTVGSASVNVASTGGTLTSGTHYVALADPTTVTFADGVSSASFDIQLNAISAGLIASGASIDLALSSPTNSATIGTQATATLTITGTPGSISISAASYNVREEIGTFQLPLVRTGGTTGAVSVTVSTTAGTATAGTDFTAITNQVVTFAEGVSTVNVPVTILNTVANEPNELFTVTISGASAVGTTSATLRILDADAAAPTLTLTAPKAGSKVTGNATVNLVGSAKDNKELASIQLQFNGAAAVNVPFTLDAKGVPSFTFPVTAQRGTNIAVLRAYDFRGNASAAVSVNFIFDDPFAPLAGTYKGLARPSETTVPSHSNNGLVDIAVTAAGSFSGKLTIDGLVLPFSGVIGNNGIARIGASGVDKFRVERPNKPAFEISFALDLSSTPGVKRITGTVTEYRRATLVGTSSLTAERAGFGKTASVPANYTGNKGAYTFVVPVQPQSSAFNAQDYPQGDGVGTATVKADGSVTLAGTLADGTKFTASSVLWANLSLPLYVELYAKAGSFGGTITFNDLLPASDFSGTNLFWFRPYQNLQHYPYGWPEGLATVLNGAKYVVGATSSLGTLPPANADLGNAALEFTDGLLSEDVTKAVNVDVKDKATNAPVADKSFSLSITQASGLFSGKFTHTDGTQPAFSGVVYQKGSQRGGYGHFLSSTPKVRDGTGEAGAVTLSPRQ
ncbi:Calx-beta domain-containing protein [Brevifollis gellanilyticus]|uniref:Calx-beta domain-containing protein n=1 Tax=Brevifollis gellanilyticus TaxID=748831 RepID=A0A512MC62_9BACT|nr:Calx-beta domain-containing protein [Brevifollis gellanilyticus]GEP44323.1 hypothetical protein BGE01nite_36140 [Brevifollis gellanilyticus]